MRFEKKSPVADRPGRKVLWKITSPRRFGGCDYAWG
jgi:hypothetical protein